MRALYAAKGRPASNPLIVHVLSAAEARPLVAEWPALAQKLTDAFWPGPLTLVLPRSPLVPDEVTAGGPTVAVRAPDHRVARALLQRIKAPVAAPSANRSEHVSPTSAAHVLADLDGRIDAVLDGGPCEHGIESSVVQLVASGPRLLRAGAISRVALEAVCGPLALGPEASAGTLASPGLHARHYAPAAQVRLAKAEELAALVASLQPPVGAVHYSEQAAEALSGGRAQHVVRLAAGATDYARGLYAALRDLEGRGCGALAIEEVPAGAEWDAVRDRLARAAG